MPAPFELALVDHDAALALAMLRSTDDPVTIEDLRAAGVFAPAQALYELQLAGYQVVLVGTCSSRRSGRGYMLRRPSEAAPAPARMRRP